MISERVKEYYNLTQSNEVRDNAKKLRRQYLRYKDAEIVCSMTHKKLFELASALGAIYRIASIKLSLISTDVLERCCITKFYIMYNRHGGHTVL